MCINDRYTWICLLISLAHGVEGWPKSSTHPFIVVVKWSYNSLIDRLCLQYDLIFIPSTARSIYSLAAAYGLHVLCACICSKSFCSDFLKRRRRESLSFFFVPSLPLSLFLTHGRFPLFPACPADSHGSIFVGLWWRKDFLGCLLARGAAFRAKKEARIAIARLKLMWVKRSLTPSVWGMSVDWGGRICVMSSSSLERASLVRSSGLQGALQKSRADPNQRPHESLFASLESSPQLPFIHHRHSSVPWRALAHLLKQASHSAALVVIHKRRQQRVPGDGNKRDPERENWPCRVMLPILPIQSISGSRLLSSRGT